MENIKCFCNEFYTCAPCARKKIGYEFKPNELDAETESAYMNRAKLWRLNNP